MSDQLQQAVFLTEVGKPVQLGYRSVPTPGDGQVLIEVASTMLLPHDSYGRAYGLFVGQKLPWFLGANIAGQMVKLGRSCTASLKVGDRVFGFVNFDIDLPDQGGLQEYCLLDVDSLAKTPDSFTDDEVATLPVNIVTSFMALFSKNGFDWPTPWAKTDFDYSAQTVVVIGAGSNVAHLFVELAKITGVGRVIAIAGPSTKERLLKIGAMHVIDRHQTDNEIKEQVNAIVGDAEGVTHVYDCYSWTFELGESLLSTTKPSSFITLHPVDGSKIRGKLPHCDAQFINASSAGLAPNCDEFWTQLPVWLEERRIFPTEFRVFEGLDRVNEINQALDDYLAAKAGPQVIVHS